MAAAVLLGAGVLLFLPGASPPASPGPLRGQKLLGARTGRTIVHRPASKPPSRYVNRTGIWASPRGINVPVGRIEIPAVGLRVPFRLGVYDAVVQLGPGLWPGTPLPGSAGNAVLAGHRTTYTHPFGDLDLLRRGDRIRTHLRGQGATVYTVFRTAVVPEEIYRGVVLRQPRRPGVRIITLFACTPKGQRTHRIVVRARASRLRAPGAHVDLPNPEPVISGKVDVE